jgi:hypothetical protein
MEMIIRYRNGHRIEAVLLAANSERMRVAIDSQRDTVELHKVGAGWRTQRGATIEVEALIPIPGTEFARFCAAFQPRLGRGNGRPERHVQDPPRRVQSLLLQPGRQTGIQRQSSTNPQIPPASLF